MSFVCSVNTVCLVLGFWPDFVSSLWSFYEYVHESEENFFFYLALVNIYDDSRLQSD